MHKNHKDVCLEVKKIVYEDYKRKKLKARWVNLGYVGNPWPLTDFETIEISLIEWLNWSNITDRIHNPRDKDGFPE